MLSGRCQEKRGPPRLAGRPPKQFSHLIEGGVKGVKVFGIQLVGQQAQALAEMIHLSSSLQTQCFPEEVIDQQDFKWHYEIFYSHGFLWYNVLIKVFGEVKEG